MTSARPGPLDGDLVLQGRIMPASNATFLGDIGERQVVYKPIAGEQPLWDFPGACLAERELAAYLVSEAMGWDVVPLTWLRDGPHGQGMVQLWQEPDPAQDAVTLVREGAVPTGWLHVFDGIDGRERPVSLIHEDSAALRRMAVFDVVVNNADRKGGHVLEMSDGHRYGVDHGIAFHHEPKLRTVLWGWAGTELTSAERTAVQDVASLVEAGLVDGLEECLDAVELEALVARCRLLLAEGVLPGPGDGWPAVPWPPF